LLKYAIFDSFSFSLSDAIPSSTTLLTSQEEEEMATNQARETETMSWSVIEETPIYLEKLKLLVDSEKVLQSAGYVLRPLEPEQVESKKRCVHCGGEQNPRRSVSNTWFTQLAIV
jgi:hypothetical protein